VGGETAMSYFKLSEYRTCRRTVFFLAPPGYLQRYGTGRLPAASAGRTSIDSGSRWCITNPRLAHWSGVGCSFLHVLRIAHAATQVPPHRECTLVCPEADPAHTRASNHTYAMSESFKSSHSAQVPLENAARRK
jgi:hypothetical protein